MMCSRFRSLYGVALMATGLGISSTSLAQDPAPAPLPPPPETVTPAPVAPPPPPPPVVLPAQEAAPVAAPLAPVEPEKPVTEPAGEEEEKPWTDAFTVGAFVDAYGAIRSDNNESRAPSDGATVAGPVGYGHEAYVQASGFALAFAGVDLAYAGDTFGATVSLRFGPGVNRFFVADMGPFGIDNVTQAFATWKPFDGLTLDIGQFYTIYGAEVAESWKNVNYSRGALYYAMQPFWHTGLRINYAINDMLALNALVVNGVNTAFEGNKSPSLGIQALLTPNDMLFFAVGYLGGLNPRDGDDEQLATANFENFIDVVGTLTVDRFKLVANFDYNLYRPQGVSDSENWWGISVAPAIGVTDWFGIGARVEYVADSANSQLLMPDFTTPGELLAKKTSLTTLTATLDFKPVPQVILRPEIRYELASDDDYLDRDNGPTDKFWSLHLGAVVTSMP